MTGGTGVLGLRAMGALLAAGHEVTALARSEDKARLIMDQGAVPVIGDLFADADLRALFEGADAVVNLATHIPVGYASALPRAWRTNDLIRTKGVAAITRAAVACGVRRVVQESVSYLYADGGDSWLDEESALEVTAVTEPVSVAESHVARFGTAGRVGVALRFGMILGDDRFTRFSLRSVRTGRPVGFGRPESWSHVIHTDDLGSAVLAALVAPNGVYNVGARPVRRQSIVDGYAEALEVPSTGFVGPVIRRLGGPRMEPLSRSLRVCSEKFTANTGWLPSRPTFDADWFAASTASLAGRSR